MKRPTNLFHFFDAIEQDQSSLQHELHKFMIERGWKHTSNTPSCVWMWEKKLPDGRVVLTNISTAMDFERELHSNECPYTEIRG